MNQENPIVDLCTRGMEAEAQGRPDSARALFAEAWNRQRDDYEACIAAHYLARHQASEQKRYRWNAEALRRADAVDDDRIKPFYPSLYLNMGYSYEMLGRMDDARRHYLAAERSQQDLVPGAYAEMIRRGIERALARTTGIQSES